MLPATPPSPMHCRGHANWCNDIGNVPGEGSTPDLPCGHPKKTSRSLTEVLFIKPEATQTPAPGAQMQRLEDIPSVGQSMTVKRTDLCRPQQCLRVPQLVVYGEARHKRAPYMTSVCTQRRNESLWLESRTVASSVCGGLEVGEGRRGPMGASGALTRFYVMHGPGGDYMGGPPGKFRARY